MYLYALIIIVVISIIFYYFYMQKFIIYTSGAQQRYASEFTSTNQENFTNHNRYANDKHKIHHNSIDSELLERELFTQMHPVLNI